MQNAQSYAKTVLTNVATKLGTKDKVGIADLPKILDKARGLVKTEIKETVPARYRLATLVAIRKFVNSVAGSVVA